MNLKLKRMWLSGPVLVALVVQTQAAGLNLIDDTYGVGAGSFELGSFVDAGGYMRLAPGSGQLGGWTIGGDGADWLTAPYARAAEGAMSLDLAAQTAGWIETTIPTVAGAVFNVAFDSYAGQQPNTGLLRFGSSAPEAFSPVTALEAADAIYQRFVYSFVASSDSTVLRFEAANTSGFGPVIDNVSVDSNAIPEPSSLASIGLVGLFGLWLRRKLR